MQSQSALVKMNIAPFSFRLYLNICVSSVVTIDVINVVLGFSQHKHIFKPLFGCSRKLCVPSGNL